MLKTLMRKTNKNKKNNKIYPYIFCFLAGLLIFSYPLISQWYYSIDSQKIIEKFDNEKTKLNNKDVKEKIELARAYNRTLDPSKLADPYTDKEKKGLAEYARMLEMHEMIGHVEVPKLKINLPIYAGTSDYVLEKGAGHLEGSSLPVGGESTHTVITAHRGLASAEMFRNLDKLQEGDIFLIHNIAEILAYKVDKITVVEPTNFDPVLVEMEKDYATLLTCTPYVINSHRLLVRGHRVPYTKEIVENQENKYCIYIILGLIIILLLIISLIYYIKKKKKRNEKNDK